MSAESQVRTAAARSFYPGDCRALLSAYLEDSQPPADLPLPLHGAALPHAGWMYSGSVAAHTLDCFRSQPPPDTVILFGAVHDPGVLTHALYPEGSWETPLGELPVDQECGTAILAAASDILRASPEAHRYEHSIEVLAPMVRYFWPEAFFVPIMVLPQPSAVRIGQATAEGAAHLKRRVVFLASSDLTHYGPRFGLAPAGSGPSARAWMEANDRRMIDTLCRQSGQAVLDEARANRNACGSGALAALKGALAAVGAGDGFLVQYATSFDVEPERVFTSAVGYAGIVF